MKLGLPHLKDLTGRKVVRLRLTAEASGNNHCVAVLSDNNALTRCPVSRVRRDGGELTYDIAFKRRNSAHVSARYVLAPISFRGRIAMQTGGKNMTMTEVQSGRRTGPCDAGKMPALRAVPIWSTQLGAGLSRAPSPLR